MSSDVVHGKDIHQDNNGQHTRHHKRRGNRPEGHESFENSVQSGITQPYSDSIRFMAESSGGRTKPPGRSEGDHDGEDEAEEKSERPGRSKKEFFLGENTSIIPPVPDGYESDFHKYYPKRKHRRSASRSSSQHSASSDDTSMVYPTYTLQPAKFDSPSRGMSPHPFFVGPSSAYASNSSPLDYRNPPYRETSPPCSFSGPTSPGFPLSRDTSTYVTSYTRGNYPCPDRNDAEKYSTSRYVSPLDFDRGLYPLDPHSPSRYSPDSLSLSAKAQGKQRRHVNDDYDADYDSGIPSSELADLCLENGTSHPYSPGINVSMVDPYYPERLQYDGHARPPGPRTPLPPRTSAIVPPPRLPPPPHLHPPPKPPLLPQAPQDPHLPSFVPGRNPRGRPKSNTVSGLERDESPANRKARATKRPAQGSGDEGDEEWDPGAENPSKGNVSGSPTVKKKRKTNRYPCLVAGCKETFTRKNDVRRHVMNAAIHRDSPEALKLQNKDKDIPTRCTYCNADLSRPDARMRHERTSACGKRTTQKMKDQMIVMRLT
ncbi:hypothetical protein PQX77_006411 [Marasmius sp. AFHP31]|nr:hypothetical protein PQX77_006411 [Marasmius sp. AFHP31]